MAIQLIQPSAQYLDAYLETLAPGWSPSSFLKSAEPLQAEIDEVNANHVRFSKTISI